MTEWDIALKQLQTPVTMACWAVGWHQPDRKKCTTCNCRKPIEDFPPHPYTRDGRQSSCKPCIARKARERDAKRRAKLETN